MDIFELIKNKKRAKWIAIGVVIAVVFIFVLFPIFSKFFEESTSASAISQTAIKGTSIIDGGNNYITIKEKSEEEENLLEILSKSNAWNTSIVTSRQYQILWYKTLSSYLEKTYLQELKSDSRKTPSVLKKTYYEYSTCDRKYDGDYSNDECDFNGPITNKHNLEYASKDSNGNYEVTGSCAGVPLIKVNQSDIIFYQSSDEEKDVGGKILGMYPDVLATITLANTYATLDQNKNTDEYKLVEQYENIKKMWEQGKISGMPYSAVQGMMNYVKKWYEGSESAAVINAALDDTFTEGSIYSTFDFSMGSTCKAKDVVGYYSIEKLPCENTYDDNKRVTKYKKEYDCVKTETIATGCSIYTDSNGNTIESPNETRTDGDPNTYYESLDNTKYCDYVWDGEDEPVQDGLCPRTKKGPFYKIQVKWICNPEKPVENITCTPIAVYDDRDKEQKNPLYYYCGDVSLSDVRTQIVDKVFDAYEKNELEFNKYMTEETVIKYTYPDSEDATDGEETKDDVRGQINPKGYLIDEETRNIVAKHIQLEITGQTEGRSPVICDEYGHFALQSYNRVLNVLQFKDALKTTLFVKDDILRRKGELTDKNNYSEKIFGTFYSSSNTNFSNLSPQEIAAQTRLDQSKKNSLIIEIFSSYEYISEYLKDNNSILGANGRVTGTGLARADSTGYATRTSMPFYGTDSYNKYYSIGLYGECAWYATGRIREILATAGSSYNWTTNVNGGDFCYTAQAQDFTVTGKQDYDKPQKGAVISWRGGSHGYGHVAIVEEVYYDANGKPESVLVSEGGLNINSSVSGTYTSNYIWNHDTLANRKTQCSNGRCFNLTKLTINELRVRFGSYQFQCYIYLLKDGTNQSTNPADAAKKLSNQTSNGSTSANPRDAVGNLSGSTGNNQESSNPTCNFTPVNLTNGVIQKGEYGYPNYVYEGSDIGQCPWYANGRAKEILKEAGINKNPPQVTNGGWYCNNPGDFSTSSNYKNPRKGAIISWTGGTEGYGHVAIVEDVKYDSAGNATDVLISESNVGCSNCYRAKWHSINEINNSYLGSNYKFSCYIYLIPKNCGENSL